MSKQSELRDVAVVGISASCGGAGGLREFWRDILGADASARAEAGTPGGDVRDSTTQPDAAALTLRLAQDALEDAGYSRRPHGRERICLMLVPGHVSSHGPASPGSALAADGDAERTASLVAVGLGVPRENVSIQTSSRSLAALKSAVRELEAGTFDAVLFGDLRPSGGGDGETSWRRAGGMLLLKRLDDARSDGNQIYALLKAVFVFGEGSAVESLGGGEGGVAHALGAAYDECGVTPRTVALAEVLADGTESGLRSELKTLAAAFGARRGLLPWCALGHGASSVGARAPATNGGGNSGGNSGGIVALIKAMLALHYAILPPARREGSAPDAGDGKSPFYFGEAARPWIHGDAESGRRAAVHQSGPGGAAHVVLEEYAHDGAGATMKLLDGRWPTELLCFSGAGREDLLALLGSVQNFIAAHPSEPVANLAKTLARRPKGSHRLAVVARDLSDLKGKLELASEKLSQAERRPHWQVRRGIFYAESDARADVCGRVAFTFPGYGSYYPRMLSDLCMSFPAVRRWFDELDGLFDEASGPLPSQLLHPPSGSLSGEESRVVERNLHGMRGGAQAGLFSTLALHELLSNLGVGCDALVGHSNGENAALIASGAMRFETRAELFKLIRRFTVYDDRAVTTDHLPKGVFLGVSGLDAGFIRQLLDDSAGRLHLAMDNCPHQVVLFAGEAEAAATTARITKAGGIVIRLPFDRAYHTPLYESQEETIRTVYDSMKFARPRTPIYSCVTAERFPEEPERIRELAIKQWSSGVRFRETLEALYRDGVRTFVEVGPNSTLTAFANDTLRDREHLALAFDTPRVNGLTQLQHLLAQLFVRGTELDLSYLFGFRDVRTIALTPRGERADAAYDADGAKATGDEETWSTSHPASGPWTSAPHPESVETARAGASVSVGGNGVTHVADAAGAPSFAGGANGTPHARHVAGGLEAQSPVRFEAQSDVQTAILRGHFELMREFLDGQRRVLASVSQTLKTRGDTAAAGVAVLGAPLEGSDAGGVESWPLLGTPIEADGRRLYCERVFTIEDDFFLRDHAMGRQPAGRQPRLSPLPVVPFTVSMEILAEAACRLAGGGKAVAGIHDARGHRWLALERDTLRLGILARLRPARDGGARGEGTRDVHVQLFDLGATPAAPRHLAFEGTVRVADAYPPPPTAPARISIRVEQGAPPAVSPARFYGDFLFHGPCFQGVKRLRACGPGAIEAELEVPDARGFFRHGVPPDFRTPAALLDSAGQLVALWRVERGEQDFGVFPFEAESLRQYGPPPPGGSKVVCRATLCQTRATLLEADFEFEDERGLVFASLHGFRLRGYDDEYVSRLLKPQGAETFFSEPWMRGETRLASRRVSRETAGLLEDGGGIWKRVLAHLVLGDSELSRWHGLPEKGPRRLEWLMGRTAAKDAVRQWAFQTFKLELPHADIEIVTDELGRPFVKCPALEAEGVVPHVSISHTGGEAVAVADTDRVGIDIERLDARRSDGWWRAAFDAADLSAIGKGDAKTFLGLWCAKEAAAKARGTGLLGDPREWRIVDYSPSGGRVKIEYGGTVSGVALWYRGETVIALCRLSQADVESRLQADATTQR